LAAAAVALIVTTTLLNIASLSAVLSTACPANLSETVSATRELTKKCPAVLFGKPAARGVYSYFQAKTGCSRSSTGSFRPSSPSHLSCSNTAPVGA
jgi:hypothetical protein